MVGDDESAAWVELEYGGEAATTVESSDLRDGKSEREEGERKVVSRWNGDGEAA